MNKYALVLLLTFGLISGSGASILPAKKHNINSVFQKTIKITESQLFANGTTITNLPSNNFNKLADSLKSKRITAAILTLPLGMLGVHRMYLGTKPIVPIVYILTFGGGFGILPFIDFVVLLISDETKPFINNSRVFMWNKPKNNSPSK